ncbi:MAG: hypothetical protein MZW92_43040 [Comamonadaceae bacterium]|nr:hypothetical protein [Comamonadaceae bacterium]
MPPLRMAAAWIAHFRGALLQSPRRRAFPVAGAPRAGPAAAGRRRPRPRLAAGARCDPRLHPGLPAAAGERRRDATAAGVAAPGRADGVARRGARAPRSLERAAGRADDCRGCAGDVGGRRPACGWPWQASRSSCMAAASLPFLPYAAPARAHRK